MAQSKNGTDNLSKDLTETLEYIRVRVEDRTDFRRIASHQNFMKAYKKELMERLVIYITERDRKIFDHAYKLGKNEQPKI